VQEVVFSVRKTRGGGYVAWAVGSSIVTQADSLERLKALVRDAAECHFDPEPAPKSIRLLIVHEEVVV
jgi:hypothetical protein